jgi:hypothetical protein
MPKQPKMGKRQSAAEPSGCAASRLTWLDFEVSQPAAISDAKVINGRSSVSLELTDATMLTQAVSKYALVYLCASYAALNSDSSIHLQAICWQSNTMAGR